MKINLFHLFLLSLVFISYNHLNGTKFKKEHGLLALKRQAIQNHSETCSECVKRLTTCIVCNKQCTDSELLLDHLRYIHGLKSGNTVLNLDLETKK